jgi:hypothetical protein
MFAGQVRHPEATKREWAVLASRILVVAGGIFLVRLILLSHEERVPILLLRARDVACGGEPVASLMLSVIGLRARGYELVPLADIVMFIREHRYVPKKCFGLVVESSAREELADILAAAGETSITVVLPLEALRNRGGGAAYRELPETAALGTVWTASQDVRDQGQQVTEEYLRAFGDLGARLLGKKPEYALLEGCSHIDLRALLRTSGYTCFLDGEGYNRFGDESHVMRVMDVSCLVRRRTARQFRVMLYMSMFKGTYIGWPLLAIWRMFKARSAKK